MIERKGNERRLLAAVFLFWFSVYTYPSFLTTYATDTLGATKVMAGMIVGSYGLTQMVLRIPLGIVSDIIRKRKPFVMLGFALSILRDPTAAEDVMQDTFVSVMQSAPGYQPSGKPMAWLLTIARNLALMRLRKAENKNLSFDELFHVEDTHDAYQVTENHMVLEKVLHTLTDSERQIVMLHALSGLKHREVADLLGIPQATAISRYNRALGKLRNSMGGDDLDR